MLIDQPRAIDKHRFSGDVLTVLTESELAQVEECLEIVLGLGELNTGLSVDFRSR